VTPFLTARTATISLVVYCTIFIFIFIFAFGSFYIHRLLRMRPIGDLVLPAMAAVPNRPMSVVEPHIADGLHVPAGE
jgi:cytochrome d ubiquinol oxidase subunit I